MPENEILAEIRRTRETIARENEGDVAKLFRHFRAVSAKLEAEGWLVSAPEPGASRSMLKNADAACAVREDSPEK